MKRTSQETELTKQTQESIEDNEWGANVPFIATGVVSEDTSFTCNELDAALSGDSPSVETAKAAQQQCRGSGSTH